MEIVSSLPSIIATQNLRIHACSWNLALEPPTEDLDLREWLGLDSDEKNPDIVAVGLQEVSYGSYWEERILDSFHQENYVRVKQRWLKWLYIAVFAKRTHIKFITNVESESTKTGFMGYLPNKGSVSVRLDFYGVNLIFVNSHFAALKGSTGDRIADFNDTVAGQNFRDADVTNILDHDYVFWMGDLNFRLDDISKVKVEKNISDGKLKNLWTHDQLTKCKNEGLVFLDFEEGTLNFDPTFKFDKGTDNYDTSPKQRVPAWTDRVLYMIHEDAFENFELNAKLLSYNSHPSYKLSDHKPISATFEAVFMKHGGHPIPIEFAPVVTNNRSFTVSYLCSGDLELSTWDWIGVYPKRFKHSYDYATWQYAKIPGKKEDGVSVTFSTSRWLVGDFVLGYFNRKKNCLVGYSDVFTLS